MVNEQLAQLYIDMEMENDSVSPSLKLEEANTSSSSGGSCCEDSSLPPHHTIKVIKNYISKQCSMDN